MKFIHKQSRHYKVNKQGFCKSLSAKPNRFIIFTCLAIKISKITRHTESTCITRLFSTTNIPPEHCNALSCLCISSSFHRIKFKSIAFMKKRMNVLRIDEIASQCSRKINLCCCFNVLCMLHAYYLVIFFLF